MQRLPRAYYEDRNFKTRSEIRASQVKFRPPVKVSAVEHGQQIKNVETAIETQDAEVDQSMLRGLNYEDWLLAASKPYKISPRIEDYILVSTVICPSDIPNRNGIAFPATELVKFQPPPMNRTVWEAWKGCPIHLEHDNEVHERAHGVILDTAFTRVRGYGGGNIWKVMGLLGIDKNKYPDVAQKVLDGRINTYSMGALVDCFRCSYCGTECYHDPRTERHIGCHHITSIKTVNWGIERDHQGQEHLSYLNAYGISPIECSIVEDPAWAPALSDTVWEHTPTPKQEPDVRQVVRDRQGPPRTPDGPIPGGPQYNDSPSFLKDIYNLKWS